MDRILGLLFATIILFKLLSITSKVAEIFLVQNIDRLYDDNIVSSFEILECSRVRSQFRRLEFLTSRRLYSIRSNIHHNTYSNNVKSSSAQKFFRNEFFLNEFKVLRTLSAVSMRKSGVLWRHWDVRMFVHYCCHREVTENEIISVPWDQDDVTGARWTYGHKWQSFYKKLLW